MSEMPGPEVAVKARAPAHPAPRTMPIEAISSSAWMIGDGPLSVPGSTRCSLAEVDERLAEGGRRRDRVPAADRGAAEEAAEGGRRVPLDDDLSRRGVHPLDAERDLLREVFAAEYSSPSRMARQVQVDGLLLSP